MKRSLVLLLSAFLSTFSQAQTKRSILLVGTYTNTGKSEGIYAYKFDIASASASLLNITREIINPSYLSVSADQKFAYVVHERDQQGAVSAFSLDAKTGILTLLNTVKSEGAGPCHVTVDEENVLVANYRSGSLAVFNRLEDGSLSKAVQIIEHLGKSVHPKSQTSSHVHMNEFTPDHRYVISNDLGEDQSYIYQYDPVAKDRNLTLKGVVKATPGSGPRHLTFSPSGKFAYLVNELNGYITAFSYLDGQLQKIQEIHTTSSALAGKIDGADIHLSADGKYLYETNRGEANTISTFKVKASGKIKHVETIPTQGKGPRNFAIDPGDNFLLVAQQYSDEVVTFIRNKRTGRLRDSGQRIQVGAPACLVFLK